MFKGIPGGTDAGVPLSTQRFWPTTSGRLHTQRTSRKRNDTLPDMQCLGGREDTAGGGLITGQAMDAPSRVQRLCGHCRIPAVGNAYVNVVPPWSLNSNPVCPASATRVCRRAATQEKPRAPSTEVGAYRLRAGLIHMLRFAYAAEARTCGCPTGRPIVGTTISDVSGNALFETSGAFKSPQAATSVSDFILGTTTSLTRAARRISATCQKFYPHGGWAQIRRPGRMILAVR
jgi:hypothetical protein